MASISSLLRQAEAARKRQLAFEQDVAAYNWSISAKTPDDWAEYSAFLNQRLAQATDPSQLLTFTRLLQTSENAFVSAEIERESIKILEGNGTLQTKLAKVSELLARAYERGNFDLAQNLYKQGLTLQDQIADEQERAQRVAGAMARNQSKDLKDLVTKLEKGIGEIQVGPNEAYKSLYTINQELKTKGDTDAGLFTDAWLTTKYIKDLVDTAYNTATSQDAVDYIEEKLRPVIDGSKTYKIGGIEMTASEIDLAYHSALANNPIYSVTTGADAEGAPTFAIKKNVVEDFTWVLADDGRYEAVAVQSRMTNEDLETQLSDTGARLGAAQQFKRGDQVRIFNEKTGKYELTKLAKDETLSPFYDPVSKQTVFRKADPALNIANRLALLGYTVQKGKDGRVTLTTRDGRIYTDAVLEGDKIRFMGDPNEFTKGAAGIYEINLTDVTNFGRLGNLPAGTVRAVAPDETSDFAQRSEFGGFFGRTSEAGKAAILSLSGVSNFSTPRYNIDQVVESLKVKDFTAPRITTIDTSGAVYGTPGTSSLLQSAGMTRNMLEEKNRAQEQARLNAQITSQALNLPNAPGLNQTPVRNLAQNGAPVRQLKVTSAPPTPQRVQVTTAQPARRITGVDSTSNFSGRLQVR